MLAWAAETTLLAAGLSVLALAIGRLGRLGPAARHALWLVVLVRLLTPPLFHWPAWISRNVASAKGQWTAPATAESEPVLLPRELTGPLVADEFEPIGPLDGAEPASALLEEPIEERPAEPWPSERARAIARIALGGIWAAGGAVVATVGLLRLVRFRRRLSGAKPAPEWLEDMVADLADRFGVPAPTLAVVPGLESPLLWCAGRPKLLVPKALLGRLEADRWRGIIGHELAHLRRRDPWVSRLLALAAPFWWWNPIFWLTRSRLGAEAELACDAWALSVEPRRRSYADVLIDVCALSSAPARPAPAVLGIGGSGRFFERRLTMILLGPIPRTLPRAGRWAVALLALLAAPSWSTGQQIPPEIPVDDPPPARADDKRRAEAEANAKAEMLKAVKAKLAALAEAQAALEREREKAASDPTQHAAQMKKLADLATARAKLADEAKALGDNRAEDASQLLKGLERLSAEKARDVMRQKLLAEGKVQEAARLRALEDAERRGNVNEDRERARADDRVAALKARLAHAEQMAKTHPDSGAADDLKKLRAEMEALRAVAERDRQSSVAVLLKLAQDRRDEVLKSDPVAADREKLRRLGDELTHQRADLEQKVRDAQTQLERAQVELREQQARFKQEVDARRQRLAETEARLDQERARLDRQQKSDRVGVAAAREVLLPLPERRESTRRDESLERRMDNLERKFDQLLEELRTMRREHSREAK